MRFHSSSDLSVDAMLLLGRISAGEVSWGGDASFIELLLSGLVTRAPSKWELTDTGRTALLRQTI